MFPMLSGITWDLGTLLTALVMLWMIAEGAGLLWTMMDRRIQGHFSRKHADYWLDQAEDVRRARNTLQSGSSAWAEQDLLYKKMIRKAADSRLKGWR